jgi:hypothetical protein
MMITPAASQKLEGKKEIHIAFLAVSTGAKRVFPSYFGIYFQRFAEKTRCASSFFENGGLLFLPRFASGRRRESVA